MSSSADTLAALTIAQLHRSIVSYFNVIAASAYVYDFLLTFDTEVEQIWKAKWTFLKVAYLLQRYLPFFDTVYLSVYHGSAPDLGPAYCQKNYTATIITDMLSMIGISEGILTFRTWAVWGRDRKVGTIIGTAYIVYFSVTATFGVLFLRGLTFGIFPIPGFDGCFITGGNAFLSICWMLLMFYDAWMVGWMAVPALRTFRQGGENALTRTVFRDGIIYYVYLFFFSLINAVLSVALPHDVSFVLVPLERVMVSILTSRVVLGIRSAGNVDVILSSEEHSQARVMFATPNHMYFESIHNS